MSGHTPGPWIDCEDEQGSVYVAGDDGSIVCYVVNDANRTLDSNARLIAAAPDLLMALQACLKEGIGNGPSHEGYLSPSIRSLAEQAIAKATGNAA